MVGTIAKRIIMDSTKTNVFFDSNLGYDTKKNIIEPIKGPKIV